MKETRKIKVIGAGGIGTYLIEPLARYLHFCDDNCEVTIIDGDKYEEKNKTRQRFKAEENKADHTAALLKEEFQKVHIRSKGEFVTPDNVISIIRENDIVFMCVDNHATRKLVSDRCQQLKNITLISGGNDYTDGNVILYIRKDGKDVTKSPTALSPHIANPTDENPGLVNKERQGCEQEVATNKQLLFANMAVASHMLNVYYAVEQNKANFHQVYFDILTQRARPAPEQF